MKVKQKINVSAQEFYNFLIENLKHEMKINGKIKEGMKFNVNLKTKTNQIAKSNVEIINLVENSRYTLKYISSLGENIVDYKINELNVDNIEIDYEEIYITKSNFQRYNHIFMEFFYSFFLKRKKKKMLKAVENYLINKRMEKNND
ncbi:DUF3284 domain-containing protein [Streptobacillus moniliformis]|uniref:DUF3284 domain-containing protein n=2 Tax=Streptobacillus moniliformis TaxID=34105 RepID=D1AWL2_STRM9|nr:DUF3284 domain-containing protein [Streptobacillus moniliformis]ACZ00688.1 hypothetical protein Smon_0201 [Streptobacillus moniliformis DSM 12112]AVL42913.1 DUF3284 domain-containing protein [Streptobacillus moniliformis]SQA14185.1 Domain of uncharacterised function (DUF3284) [Streptobacillus moniliformis]